jgi:hypothetical protein
MQLWQDIVKKIFASADVQSRNPGFESRQGARFLVFLYIAVPLPKLENHLHCVYVFEKNECCQNKFKNEIEMKRKSCKEKNRLSNLLVARRSLVTM